MTHVKTDVISVVSNSMKKVSVLEKTATSPITALNLMTYGGEKHGKCIWKSE
jgi:hypothetical protein